MLDDLKEFVKEIGPQEGKSLVSCFHQGGEWKVDFYDPKKHKILTFTRIDGKIKSQEDEIFQKEDKDIEELDLEKVKISRLEALDKLEEAADKVITIIQVIDSKILWNITVITSTFDVYNVKIDAVTGDKISDHKESIFNFKKK
tara:strand:- start:14 stop:445 length:432 start_codon:yes stop_codon:yes gene_type:complete